MDGGLDSECSSGCESGWTVYLEPSFISQKGNNGKERGGFSSDGEKKGKFEDEEEDLSMISDASSGPPHFHEEDYFGNFNNGCFYNNASIDHATLPKLSNGRIGKKLVKEDCKCPKGIEEQRSLLDDTASSPIFNFSDNNLKLNNNQASMGTILEFSQGHSTNHIQGMGRSAFQGNLGFYQSSLSGKQQQQNQWFDGKRWG